MSESENHVLENEITPKYENLVISGGSTKGIASIGAIKYLVENKFIDLSKLKAIAGTSVGAILALLITVGFTIDEIWDFTMCLDIKKMFRPNFLEVIDKCGVENGQFILNFIEDIIFNKTGISKITFKQLYDITGIHLTIVGSCLTTREVVYFDHVNTPTFVVSFASRISISIPGFFTPVDFDNKKYLDGGMINNYPINLFDDCLDKTIGIFICNDFNTDYKCLEEFFLAIINLFMYNYYQKAVSYYSKNTIHIKNIPNNINIINFNIDMSTKQKLFQLGYNASKLFFS